MEWKRTKSNGKGWLKSKRNRKEENGRGKKEGKGIIKDEKNQKQIVSKREKRNSRIMQKNSIITCLKLETGIKI